MVVAYTAQMNECYRRLYQLLRPDKLPVAVELPRWSDYRNRAGSAPVGTRRLDIGIGLYRKRRRYAVER
jgi:hypothetical protein